MEKTILNKIKTSDDLMKAISLIDEVLMNTKGATKGELEEKLSTFFDKKLVGDLEDRSALKERLKKLRTDLESVEEIKVQLAFEPTEAFLDKLFTWFRENMKSDVIIGIEVSPEIEAGVVVSYKGKYIDLSVKKSVQAAVEKVVSSA